MKLLFCEVYEQYKNYIDSELKEQSKKAVNDRIKNHILPYFKNYNIHEIKEIDYLNWKIYIEKKNLSYKYMKTLHTTMVTFLNYCMKYYNLNSRVKDILNDTKLVKRIDEIGTNILDKVKRPGNTQSMFINSKISDLLEFENISTGVKEKVKQLLQTTLR